MMNELMNVLQAIDPAVMEYSRARLGALFLGILFYVVLHYLICAIGYSTMYRKAGEAGWKAFLPVYDAYTNYKISWDSRFFFLYAALAIAAVFLGIFTEGPMALVSAAVSLGVIYMDVKQHLNMAKGFGKGAGTAVALILFPGITALVLGLGTAEFQGGVMATN